MALNVERQLNEIIAGSFTGGNYLLQADSDSTGVVTADGRHQMTDDTISAIDDAYALVKNGEIVPPSNFSGTTPEDFPGLN